MLSLRMVGSPKMVLYVYVVVRCLHYLSSSCMLGLHWIVPAWIFLWSLASPLHCASFKLGQLNTKPGKVWIKLCRPKIMTKMMIRADYVVKGVSLYVVIIVLLLSTQLVCPLRSVCSWSMQAFLLFCFGNPNISGWFNRLLWHSSVCMCVYVFVLA